MRENGCRGLKIGYLVAFGMKIKMMAKMRLIPILLLSLFSVILTDKAFGNAKIIKSLIDPAKLDTLTAERAANARLRKICYWLEAGRREGKEPAAVIDEAQNALGIADSARAKADKSSLLRNLVILERLGCLDEAGMEKLRKGNAPKITKGPYEHDIASVDHIIPRSVAPGLDNRLYNLEFMPSRMNAEKSATIGQRQVALAKEWKEAGLISDADFKSVMGK